MLTLHRRNFRLALTFAAQLFLFNAIQNVLNYKENKGLIEPYL